MTAIRKPLKPLGTKTKGSKAAAAMEEARDTRIVVSGSGGGWMTAKDFCKVFPVTEMTIINRKNAAKQALEEGRISELPSWIRDDGGVWPIDFAKDILEEGLRQARGPVASEEAIDGARIKRAQADKMTRVMQAVAGSTVFRDDVVEVVGEIASTFDSVVRSWPKSVTVALVAWLATHLREKVEDQPAKAEERRKAVQTVLSMIDHGAMGRFLGDELDKRIADVGMRLSQAVRLVVARGKARAEKAIGIKP